jgi:DNA gyrase/topoisomerase IV subunit B
MDEYKVLSERDHVLARSGRYLGVINVEEIEDWCYCQETNKMVYGKNIISKGLLKCFDEILSNSIDEHKRNSKINNIRIDFNTDTGEISIFDNGGIAVRKHKEIDKWIPELIFSQLRSGINFDDDAQRTGSGTHGEGSVLVNIFSKKFVVETNDGKNTFKQIYENNMDIIGTPIIKRKVTDGYTKISFILDFNRFGLDSITPVLKILKNRVYEVAACNQKIKFDMFIDGVEDEVKIPNFEKFTSLFLSEYFFENSNHWSIGIGGSANGFTHISYVNSTRTFDGGTHVDLVSSFIVDSIRAFLLKKHKVDVKPSDIKNHLFLTIDCSVNRPEWSSQTKEKLISKKENFIGEFNISEKTIKLICQSEIIQSILDWIEKKKYADDKKLLRALDKVKKVEGLIDAKNKDRSKCILYIFEGESAISAVRKLRDPETIGAFPLRGKFINVLDLSTSKVIANKEAVSIMNAMGLKIGKPAIPKKQLIDLICLDDTTISADINDSILLNGSNVLIKDLDSSNININSKDVIITKNETNTLRFDKIALCCDSDYDGKAIVSLLIVFFAKYWSELFEHGKILQILTPLYVAKNKKTKIYLYSQSEYETWVSKNDTTKWEITQKKGLAALEDVEYSMMLNNPKYQVITLDDAYKKSIDDWFGDDPKKRQAKII